MARIGKADSRRSETQAGWYRRFGGWVLWGRTDISGTVEPPLAGKTTATGLWMCTLVAIALTFPHWGLEQATNALPAVGTPENPAESAAETGEEAAAAGATAQAEEAEGEASLSPDEVVALAGELDVRPTVVASVELNDPTSEQRCRILGCDAARRPPDADELLHAVPEVEDPGGVGLAHFFSALEAAESGRPGAVARVVHFGDSLIVGDWVASTIRRLLQDRFGDSGAGFVLPVRPWPWYGHEGIRLSSSEARIQRVTGPIAKDGLYGIAGVTATFSPGASASWRFAPSDEAKVFEVWYLAQSGGGELRVAAGSSTLGTVSTLAVGPESRFAAFELPPGTVRVSIHAERGPVRLFGVTFERPRPGVVWDQMGLNGGRVSLLLRLNADHWAQQLAHRRPDLVVLNFGTNESMFIGLKAETYEKALRAVVRRIRKALPQASCLLVAPMDRAVPGKQGGYDTAPTVPMLVLSQRKVALEEGCAFYDTLLAMGGIGSFGRWTMTRPKLGGGDFAHPTSAGARLLGRMLDRSIDRASDDRRTNPSTRDPQG